MLEVVGEAHIHANDTDAAALRKQNQLSSHSSSVLLQETEH